MKSLLLAGAALLGLSSPSFAANLVTFSQTSGANTLTATVNGADTATTLTINDAALSIGQFIAGAPPATAFLDFTGTSIDSATPVLGAVIQHFSGSFCVTSAVGCGGVNILSGHYSDAAFGVLSGPGLTININNPPDALSLTSSLIPASELDAPNAMSLGFTNLQPPLAIVGSTIAPFDASFAGTVSAVAAVPEPTSLALFGLSVLGMIGLRRRI